MAAYALAISTAAVMTTGCGGNEPSSFGAQPNLSLRSGFVPAMPDKHKNKMLFQYEATVGCAMDPATGNLAATIINTGAVVIYPNASGSGTVSQSPLIEAFFDSYDNHGNLYVDGFNSEGTFCFAELKKGSSTRKTLSTSNSVELPGRFPAPATAIRPGSASALSSAPMPATSRAKSTSIRPAVRPLQSSPDTAHPSPSSRFASRRSIFTIS